MRKTIVGTLLATTVVLSIAAAVVYAAVGPDREPAATTAAEAPKPAAKPSKLAQSSAPARKAAGVRCRTLRCINHALTVLSRDAFQCERILNLTRYGGYEYTGGFTTTALDYTGSGDAVDKRVVIYVC